MMRKKILRRIFYALLTICFIWCLSLPYFILSDDELISTIVKQPDKEPMETRDIMNTTVKSVDDILNLMEPSVECEKVPPLPPPRVYKGELRELQSKMEAEKEKEQLRDELIKELRSDKLQLHQQVVHLEELLKLLAEKEETKIQVKSDVPKKEDENCPLPPMDGYPECNSKIKWMTDMWKSDPCYSSYGVNGSLCSIFIYLSEIESWCPVPPGRARLPASAQVGPNHAVVQDSLTGLYLSLRNKIQFSWIHQRILSMEEIWVKAGSALSSKYNLTKRTAKHILVHPGALTEDSHTGIAQGAYSRGPLGELVQWSDLISTLYILGHHVHLSASIYELKNFLISAGGCLRRPSVEVNLIYTDIIGLKQIEKILPQGWTKYQCMIRVLDSFGTEPDFNHATWAKMHYRKSPFGMLNLIPLQFYTMFPHTPDNTFLGFVVQHQLRTEEAEQLRSTKRLNQALVYGKHAKFWEGKEAYLDVIHKYLEIHGMVDNNGPIPSYVTNHGIIKGTEVQILLRQSKVFVGLSFPYEGPAPLEALANGCAFLNPRLHPPQSSLNSQFFKGKPNTREVMSQHPYAESIGEPYVWMVDMHNSTDVERALNAILNQTIEPYLPYEFTCEGMLERVNVLIEKQDFCPGAGSWPPLSALKVVMAKLNTSCKQACQKQGLICEPAFFPHLNSASKVANYSVDCQTSALSDELMVLPAYRDEDKHCLFQKDALLFSCVRSHQSLIRICPCRDYMKDQIALCKECI